MRNATLRINYAGHNILVDPFFADKGSMQSAIGVYKTPRVHLTMPVSEITEGLDMVLQTHIHPDHYDETVKFWNKYFAPYIKTLRIEKGTGEDTMYSSRAIVYLADGTSIAIWNGGCMSMIFDSNADKSPNKLGSDRFGFEFCHKKSERATYLGENIDFGPDGLIDANSRDKAISMCKESPIKCATLLIKYDNYEFEDDYPW